MGLVEFVISACTDLAFLPALYEVAKHRRHFELFVGAFQIFTSFGYNTSKAIGFGLFLEEDDWHVMSDVLTLTYVCCLLVHCMGNSDETINMLLRYYAFSLAWMFKLKDGFSSNAWETWLIVGYVLAAGFGVSRQPKLVKDRYNFQKLKFGTGTLLVALLFLGLELASGGDSYGLLLGLMHISGAATAYFLWGAVPVLDKKFDDKRQSFV